MVAIFGPPLVIRPVALEEYLRGKASSMRRRVLAASNDYALMCDPFRTTSAGLIVKAVTAAGQFKKKPRLVINVSPVRTLIRGPLFQSLIKHLLQLPLKGLCYNHTYEELCDNYSCKFSQNWAFIYYVDFKQFELCQDEHTFHLESMIFEYFGVPKQIIDHVYSTECHWKVRNRFGIPCAFKVKGIRQSGDPQTSIGNNLLAILVHHFVCSFTCSSFDLINNGDDCILFCSHELCFDLYHFLGFNIDRKTQPEFCRSAPLWDGHRFRFCRFPHEFLTRVGFSVNASTLNQVQKLHLLAVNCLGYSHVCYGIPIYETLMHRVFNLCCVDVSELKLDMIESYTVRNWLARADPVLHEKIPITDEIRSSFAEAFGIDPERQMAIESMIDKQTDPLFTIIDESILDCFQRFMA